KNPYICNEEQKTQKYGMTREQALQWLKEVKQNKRNTVERLTKIGIDEYEKRTGVKPTYIEAL
ncbi:MAG: hypothetical protein ACOCN9_07805, partial [Prevotella sp.]